MDKNIEKVNRLLKKMDELNKKKLAALNLGLPVAGITIEYATILNALRMVEARPR